MYQSDSDIVISSVDRENNTIELIVNGCPVTAVCSSQDNPDIYERIKGILLRSMLKSKPQKGAPKFDKSIGR